MITYIVTTLARATHEQLRRAQLPPFFLELDGMGGARRRC